MSFYVHDSDLFPSNAGQLVTAAYRTSDDQLPPPLCWHLTLDLGGCDSALTGDREHVAAWGARVHRRLQLDGAEPTVVLGVFGNVRNPGTLARFGFRQPSWRGIDEAPQMDAVVRCDPDAHGVHVDVMSRALPARDAIAATTIEHFAARSGVGDCRPRRVPGLTTGFQFTWQERDL
jgi:hypothetical protein